MKSCCEGKSTELEKLRESQGKVLKVVLAINAFMFVIEFGGGIISRSSALLADSLDMFGDATVYAFSLYVLNKSQLWRARAGLLKGVIMAAFGVGILFQLISRILTETVPVSETMGLVGFMALFANLWCLYLLYKYRQDDINMRSTWLCSRNDIIANTGVLLASYLVAVTNSAWPDWVVGSVISILFISSAYGVIKESFEHLGQIPRILLAGPGSLLGLAPKGNTGGTNVGIFKPMAIPEDLEKILKESL